MHLHRNPSPQRFTVVLALAAAVLLAAAPALARGRAATGPRRSPTLLERSAAGVVNINTAPVEKLRLLPGVGPSKARAIAAYRARRPFRRPVEIVRVKGIGRKSFAKMRPYVTVRGPTTLTARPRGRR